MHGDRIRYLLLIVFCTLLCVTICNSTATQDETSDKKTTQKQPGATQKPSPASVVSATPNSNNKSENVTGKTDSGSKTFMQNLQDNKGMLLRTFYVLMAVTAIVVVYFVVRAWRTRRRKNKSRKYGLISSTGNDLEMEPLDQDDEDDEDMTVFEVNNRGKK